MSHVIMVSISTQHLWLALHLQFIQLGVPSVSQSFPLHRHRNNKRNRLIAITVSLTVVYLCSHDKYIIQVPYPLNLHAAHRHPIMAKEKKLHVVTYVYCVAAYHQTCKHITNTPNIMIALVDHINVDLGELCLIN